MTLSLALVLPTQIRAQSTLSPSPDQQLLNKIAALDRSLFDAYNKCDLEEFGSLLSDDIEFYHDKGGFTHSRKSVVAAIKTNACGKVRRELVAGTIEYPIPGYGAIETGIHRFYNRQSGAEEGGDPVKFLHVWRNKGGQYTLTRVISYAH